MLTVDSIINDLNAMAHAMTILSHIVPGGAYLASAASAITALAADRDLVQKAFDGVATIGAFGATLLAWLKDNGHGMAARYLRTVGPE